MSLFPYYIRAQVSPAKICLVLPVLVAAFVAICFVPSQEPIDYTGKCMLEDRRDAQDLPPNHRGASIDVDEALDILGAAEQRCTSINQEFEALRTKVADGGDGVAIPLRYVVGLFKQLQRFEADYVDAMLSADRAKAGHVPSNPETQSGAMTDEERVAERMAKRKAERSLQMVSSKRSTNSICFLQLVTVARHLSASLPRTGANANGALGCKHGLLGNLEARALKDAETEQDATALAHLAAHWSEIANAGRSSAPLFGPGPELPNGINSTWVQDSWGTQAPSDMVFAEDLFSRSAQVPGFKRPVLSIIHARRLGEHAKTLEVQGQHDASVHRYRAMAKLAEEAGNAGLSAHALSELSHILKLRGAHEEAIDAAKDAVALTMNPLAQFVLATARLSSGALNTDASIKAAELQLQAVAGQLPTEELEVQRAQMHSDMMMWRWISSRDISKCRVVKDAARFLICTMSKLIYP